jgi:hypothetical protein
MPAAITTLRSTIAAALANPGVAVFTKLANSAIVFNVTSVSAPSVLSVAAGDYLTADLQISILTSWS